MFLFSPNQPEFWHWYDPQNYIETIAANARHILEYHCTRKKSLG